MSLLFFFVPAQRPEPAASELNAALGQGRVLRLERHFLAVGPEPGWAFCLERADGPGPLPGALKAEDAGKPRGGAVDYKQLLPQADFTIFAALRDLRKQLSQAEGLPVYAVFTNEQLAAIVTQRVRSRADLAQPRLERSLTDVPCACRPRRGVQMAVARVQQGLRRWPWVVQVDVQGFFAHIDHAVLRAQLRRRFKGEGFLVLMDQVIAAGVDPAAPTPGRGLPIGALTSQHLANAYLDPADRLLLAWPGVHRPVRYMDDIVWFCDSAAVARESLAALRQCLGAQLGLRLKDRVVIAPAGRGLRFCGFRVRRGVLLPGARKMRRYRAAVARLRRAEPAWPQALLQRAHDAQVAALLPGHSRRFRQRLWWPDGKRATAG